MTPKLFQRLPLALLPLCFLSFTSNDGDTLVCSGCKVGASLLEATHVKPTGESITIAVDSTSGTCTPNVDSNSMLDCTPSGCTFEIDRSWFGMPSGTPIVDCWGWEHPRSGVELTRNCDVEKPAPVVDVTGSGSSFKTDNADCIDEKYYWDMTIGDMSVEVSTVCTSCKLTEG